MTFGQVVIQSTLDVWILVSYRITKGFSFRSDGCSVGIEEWENRRLYGQGPRS